MFCREALADLAKLRQTLAERGTQLAFIHMGNQEQGQALLTRYGLGDVPHFSDPETRVYRAFGLRRAGWELFFNVRLWPRALRAMRKGHGIGRMIGDVFQMPGVFLLWRGTILRTFRHEAAADQPDYLALGTCETRS